MTREEIIRNLKYTIEKHKNDTVSTFNTNISVMCKDILDYLEQEPKTGYWIVEVWNNKEHHTCSSCQHVVDYEPCYHYCPYCGARMIESQESEG